MNRTEYQREQRRKNPGRAALYQALYRERNPEKVRQQKVDSYHRRRDVILQKSKELREFVLDAYGHKCDCCGESRSEFLALDHVEGGGNRKRIDGVHPRSGKALYRWLRENNYPKWIRLLCHNCNMAIGFYGHCPHTEDK